MFLPPSTLGIGQSLAALASGLGPYKQCLFPALQPQADAVGRGSLEALTDVAQLCLTAHTGH